MTGPAARGYQSPSCVGPVKWKMAATERAHFREPSSFEGAWWPLTATVLARSPHQHITAITVFTKARAAERGSRGDPVGWCLSPGVAGVACLSHATVALWGNMTWDHPQPGGDCVSTRQSGFQWHVVLCCRCFPHVFLSGNTFHLRLTPRVK